MATCKSKWLGILAIVSTLLVSGVASAQTTLDWPTLKGSNPRVGFNLDVGPGMTNLRWWTPSSANNSTTTSTVVDNTFAGQFATLPTPVGTNPAAGWVNSPLPGINDTTIDADDPYLVFDANGNEVAPAYVYTNGVPSTTANPLQATSGTVRTAQWTLTPPTANPGSYTVSVWIPIGNQIINGLTIGSQRKYVYTVTAGGRVSTPYIIDTHLSGGGWVEIGGAFPWDSSNPIKVTLYNTNPDGATQGPTPQVVYADAAMITPVSANASTNGSPGGFYVASPVSAQLLTGGAPLTRVIDALNTVAAGGTGQVFNTIITGVVTSRQFNTGAQIWQYTPSQSSGATATVDNSTASATTGWTASPAGVTVYSGTFADETPIVAGTAPSQSLTYATPTLNTGTYAIYAYCPGNNNGQNYGQAVIYNVSEGTINPPTQCVVNQQAAGGWVQIGTRRFTHIQTTAPLTVTVTNISANAGDVGRPVYANAIRFVGEQSQAINSTPVIANVNILQSAADGAATVATQVVIVADEDGIIHCLDSKGNADGTTNEYWSYPNPNDPDSNTTSQPSNFDLSSALIQNVGTAGNPLYYLYIASQNGRIYCFDVLGDGKYVKNANGDVTQPGTAKRVWTYPPVSQTANLGAIEGSVVFADPSGTGALDTVYVPTPQGRLYALNALTGTVRWTFPAMNQPTLGPIVTTPAINFGQIFFGSSVNDADDSGGIFFALNAATGKENWQYPPVGTTVTPAMLDYHSSPAAVPYSLCAPSVSNSTTTGIVYALNQNGYVYAFDSTTGAFAGNAGAQWVPDNELASGAAGAISFSPMTVFGQAGTLVPNTPCIQIPTTSGSFSALFSDPGTLNVFGFRLAWAHDLPNGNIPNGSLAFSNSWMYGADSGGILYAFNDQLGTLSPGNPPGSDVISPNNPAGAAFRHASVTLVTQQGYNLLRLPTGQNLDYYTATGGTYNFNRTPLAFEWGETAYILVYNFPYLTTNGTSTVSPPVVNVTLSSQGKSVRTITVEARLFTEPPNAPDDPSDPNFPNGTERDNGYAILAFPFQGGGNQSIPPGPGTISISMSSSALNTSGTQQTIALNPASSNFPFLMSNPLALAMPDANGNYSDPVAIGLSVIPSQAENLVNGSPLVPGEGTKNTSLLGQAPTGIAQHGNAITAPVLVFDRSMMALLRPDNTGLDGVRVDLKNLGWQGGHLAIYKALNQSIYTNFEDLPDNFPNNSFDYPDIQSEQVVVTKDPNGTAENPRFNSVALIPPLIKDPNTGTIRPMQIGDQPQNRILQPTLFNYTVNVPRFQPANTNPQVAAGGAIIQNSAGNALNQGYLGRSRVFVDSNSNGILDSSPEEAYRSFNFSTSVDVNEQLAVTTPTIDLGTLAAGTGYDPLPPGANYTANTTSGLGANVFMPWGGNYQNLFQPFVVENRGNTNALNVRLAKASFFPPQGSNTPVLTPWGFYSTDNDLLGFLDGTTDLWSDIDTTFAPPGGPNQQVILQKARVTDIAPTQLSPNPFRRANTNLGTTGFVVLGGLTLPDVLNQQLNSTNTGYMYPPGSPHVTVSVPLGMPSGSYSNVVRVIEKSTTGQVWQIVNGAPETFSDPTMTLNFKVRETQLTNSYTANTAPMIDNSLAPTSVNTLQYSNKQPTMIRDLNGGLVVAWASDRSSWTAAQPTQASQLGNFSIFLATVGNGATYGGGGITGTADPASPLSDLNSFGAASAGQWFHQAVGNYPTTAPDILFNSLAGQTVITSTLSYGNPTFPAAGLKNPFSPSGTFSGMFMAFTGSAQKQTSEGRLGESKLFMTTISPSSGGSLGAPPAPVVMANDPQVGKGRPAVLQTSNGAMVFYGGAGGSLGNIYYTVYGASGGSASATFGPSISLPFGGGFASVSDPSVVGRIYQGVGRFKSDGVTQILAPGNFVAELTFTGQLQGRPNAEVFYGRMKVDGNKLIAVDDNGVPIDNAASDGNVFLDLTPVTNESLLQTGNAGEYRAAGVAWDRTSPIQLTQVLNGVQTDLLVPGTAVFDRETGLITYDTRLGGKVYFDPSLGTVRFPSASPSKSAALLLNYTPRFLRVSSGVGAGYTKPSLNYDARETSNAAYWRRPSGAFADFSDDIKNDRFVFTYNRSAGGAGLPPRPYVTSLRFGVQLPFRVATDSSGNPIGVQVTGTTRAVGFYQIDPANGRIYFDDQDEDNIVNVSYSAMAENGQVANITVTGIPVAILREEPEQQILIDNALNEADLTSFLDPFSYINQRRPPLLWLIWSSSRGGVPDIYFETISPQWNPIVNSPN